MLFYEVLRNLFCGRIAAGLGAACWGTCPTISWTIADYSTSGHAYAATGTLVALYLLTRPGGGSVSIRAAVGSAIAMCLGAASFGVGLGAAMAFPVAVPFLARRPYGRFATALAFASVPLVVLGVYEATSKLYRHLYGMDSFLMLDLDLRSPEVRANMVGAIVGIGPKLEQLVRAGVAAITWPLGTLAENRAPDSGKVTVAGEFIAILCLAYGLFLGSPRVRKALVGLAILLAGAFGAIGYGRWGDLTQVPRYQYFGSMILAAILTIGLCQIANVLEARNALPASLFAVGWIVTYAAFAKSKWHVEEHTGCRDGMTAAVRHIDAEIDRAPPGADVDLAEDGVPGCWLWPDFHGTAGAFMITHSSDTVRGHRVRFSTTVQDLELVHDGYPHRRFSSLLYVKR